MHKDRIIKCQCENKLTGRYPDWFMKDNCKFVYSLPYEDDGYGFKSILYRVSNDTALYASNDKNSIELWKFDLETQLFLSNKYLYTFNMKEFGTFPIKELLPIMELVEKNLEFL